MPYLGPEPGPGALIIVGVRGVWGKYLNYIFGPFTSFQTYAFISDHPRTAFPEQGGTQPSSAVGPGSPHL